jgi:hypothetical protein
MGKANRNTTLLQEMIEQITSKSEHLVKYIVRNIELGKKASLYKYCYVKWTFIENKYIQSVLFMDGFLLET